MTPPADSDRLEELIEQLGQMAGGDLERRIPISPAHDHLDAIAHGVNVLVGELGYASADLHRAKDAAEAANRAKTAFLRNVSHELRTPLSAILAVTRVLMASDLPPARRVELYERIVSNGSTLLRLLDDLLDIQRIEAGKVVLELVPVPLVKVAQAVADDLTTEAQRKGLRLTLQQTWSVDPVALADDRRIRQILINLIGNAIKFTEEGEIRISLSDREHPGQLAIDVADTGIGLTDADARALFEPFEQGHQSISSRYGGTGLGLALSRRLARELGGDVCLLVSAPGVGSTFRLTLRAHSSPTATEMPASMAGALPAMAPASSDLTGVRLLLVDDNSDIREAMTMLLEGLGAEIVEAPDALVGMDLCSSSGFDAVLMDVRMPGLDGLAAVRLLRQRGNATPVVALTADAVAEAASECFAAGFDAYLSKPVSVERLVETIRSVRHTA